MNWKSRQTISPSWKTLQRKSWHKIHRLTSWSYGHDRQTDGYVWGLGARQHRVSVTKRFDSSYLLFWRFLHRQRYSKERFSFPCLCRPTDSRSTLSNRDLTSFLLTSKMNPFEKDKELSDLLDFSAVRLLRDKLPTLLKSLKTVFYTLINWSKSFIVRRSVGLLARDGQRVLAKTLLPRTK